MIVMPLPVRSIPANAVAPAAPAEPAQTVKPFAALLDTLPPALELARAQPLSAAPQIATLSNVSIDASPTELTEPTDFPTAPGNARTAANELLPSHPFRFAELGMFGRHGAQSLPWIQPADETATDMSDLRESTANGDQPPTNPYEAGGAQQTNAVSVPAATAPGAEPESALSASSISGTDISPPTATQPSFIAQTFGAIRLETSIPAVQGAGRATRTQTPPPPDRAPNPLNVVVSGASDALTIVARSANESAEGYLRLRQLVENAAAEFGMDVSEFQLNGSATAQSFRSIVGGNHGDHAR